VFGLSGDKRISGLAVNVDWKQMEGGVGVREIQKIRRKLEE